MRFSKSIALCAASVLFSLALVHAFPADGQAPLRLKDAPPGRYPVSGRRNVSLQLFAELEELARIVDIAYCVGVTGIYRPFECASRCDEFPGYELVDTWNTGPLMSDSCGYIALDHPGKRVIAAFRGTYSVANTIVDLTTIPQEYVPYPGDPDEDPEEPSESKSSQSWPWRWFRKAKNRLFAPSSSSKRGAGGHKKKNGDRPEGPKCNNCTVHMGFFSSWKNTRRFIIPLLTNLRDLHPAYRLHLVGHSLGGAVAALAGLETDILGWNPTVTTFGEPRIGNIGLNQYLDEIFDLKSASNSSRFRRMTHMNDPVPLLPLSEWGFRMHAGEVYISKAELQPRVSDLQLCDGDQDVNCIFGAEAEAPFAPAPGNGADDGGDNDDIDDVEGVTEEMKVQMRTRWGLPARYRMWQLFFAHRDYFWRLGLCVPGGDPADWGRRYDNFTGGINEP